MNYIASYNHSGNTWLRYCLEYLTKKPTHGHRKFSISERNDNFLNIDIKAEPVATKRHVFVENELTHDDKLVLLLRNPCDAIKHNQNIEKEFLKYYSLLQEYKYFYGGRKLIVYYDDITSNSFSRFYHWISNILFVFGLQEIDFERLKDLSERFEYHKKNSINAYQNKIKKEGCNLKGIIPSNLLNHKYLERFNITEI